MKIRYLAVLIIFALVSSVCVGPVTAATSTDTAIIQSNPVQGLILDVMGEITSWELANIGDNYDNTNISMRIRSNSPWQITIHDALDGGKPAASAGHMAEWDGLAYNTTDGGRYLYYPLEIAPAVGEYPVVLNETPQLLKSGLPTQSGGGGSMGGLLYNLSINQKLRYADTTLPAGSAYRIIVTFTATNV